MQGNSEHFSSDEASDDEEDGGWLAHSSFDLRPPPPIAGHQSGSRSPTHAGFGVKMTPE